ncbi:MAG: DUF1080 domain-containing protein, partial [Chitinophagaceae bacterium]|nr:DUF1080 domain-containing protein [Chitinophagaceae bacterium]
MKLYTNRALLFVIAAVAFTIVSAFSVREKNMADNDVIGRWDLTVNMGDRVAPSWLEIKLSGIKTLVGQFVADGGSARPIAEVHVQEGKIHFSIPPQWDRTDKAMVLEATLQNDQLKGTIQASNGKTYTFTGERAPLLKRTTPVVWGAPIQLLNNNDLSGWHGQGKNNQWQNINGVLT